MVDRSLWQYCTTEESNKLLLSLELLSQEQWPADKQLACLYAISKHTSKHYYSRTIPKANGAKRQLIVPDALLKGIQRRILHNCLKNMPISVCATAYHQGTNVRSNASAHVGKAQVLNLDVRDFFSSIDFAMVYRWAFPGVYYPPEVRGLLTSLCCYQGYLPQGAPTSPAISNLVMRDFDEDLRQWCLNRGITYTRYCDDLTFSGDFAADEVKREVKRRLYPLGLVLNGQKTTVASHSQRQLVTGVVVNDKVQTTRAYRRQLRQTLYFCRKRGFAEHLRYIGDDRYLPMGEVGIRRFIQSLLGRVQYVLQMAPEDQAFLQAAQWLQQMLVSEEKR